VGVGIFFILQFIKINDVDGDTSLETLKSLSYLEWHTVDRENINKIGVTAYDKSSSFEGINLFNYDGFPEAYLIDMSGKILHEWSYGKRGWHHVEMLPNGDLLIVVKDYMLLRLNWDSELIWAKKMRFHHDIDVAYNKHVFTITRRREVIPFKSEEISILNDYLTIFSPSGKLKKNISILDLFLKEDTGRLRKDINSYIKKEKNKEKKVEDQDQVDLDLFHTNTVEVIRRHIEGVANKGDIIICARNLNRIAIVDPIKEEIVWFLKDVNLDMPHHPSLTDGLILIFDNGFHREYSRVIKVDPLTEEVVWEFKAIPEGSFFTYNRGDVQQLSNGNLLITESNKSHVFEIDSAGNLVWEYYGTEINKKRNKRRPIYRMKRFHPEKVIFLLKLFNNSQS
jgi:hypothetical protein